MGIKTKYKGGLTSLMIIKPGALGDTLMAAPSIRDLHGLCHVEFVGRNPGLYFLSLMADDVSDVEAGGWHRLFAAGLIGGPEGPSCGAVKTRPSHVAAFMRDPGGVLAGNLRLLFPDASVKMFPSLPAGTSVHVALYTARCLKDAGLPVDPERAITRASGEPLLPRKAEGPGGLSYPLLHPGSGSAKKNYPPEIWIKIIRVFNAMGFTGDIAPRILVGPAEEEAASEFRREEDAGFCRIEVSLDKVRLHRLLSEADFFAGHDSGVTHLAAMMGIPTAALFRKSDPCLWRPIGPKVKVLLEGRDQEELPDKVGRLLSCNNGPGRI